MTELRIVLIFVIGFVAGAAFMIGSQTLAEYHINRVMIGGR